MYTTIKEYQDAHGGVEACAREYLSTPRACTPEVCKCGECFPKTRTFTTCDPVELKVAAAVVVRHVPLRPESAVAMVHDDDPRIVEPDWDFSLQDVLSAVEDVIKVVQENDIACHTQHAKRVEHGLEFFLREIKFYRLPSFYELTLMKFCDAICAGNLDAADRLRTTLMRSFVFVHHAITFSRIMESCNEEKRRRTSMKLTPKMRDEQASRFQAEQHRQLYGKARQDVIDLDGDDICNFKDWRGFKEWRGL